MLSKSIEKYANSLKQKKYRNQYHRFISEGEKIASEVLKSDLKVEKILALPSWINENEKLVNKSRIDTKEVNEREMKRISSLTQPSPVLLIIETPAYKLNEKSVESSLNLVLDGIQDPGNMGTIIRITDWFAIPHIFCSEDCVDVYNPKVVQASMGSFTRVLFFEMKIEELLKRFSSMTTYATVTEGESIYEEKLKDRGFIIIGNEGGGISSSLESFIHKKISIPRYGSAESLNAAVATGLVCGEFRRRSM